MKREQQIPAQHDLDPVPHKQPPPQSEETKATHDKICAMTYYFSSTGNTLYLLALQPQRSRKLTFSGYLAPSEIASVLLGRSLYLVGGDANHTPVALTHEIVIPPDSDSASSVPATRRADLNVARCGIGLLACGHNTIFSAGGCVYSGTWKSLAAAERYDRHRDCWESMPSLKEKKAYVCLCETRGFLYAVGGYTYPSGSTASSKTIERIQASSPYTEWTELFVTDPDKVWNPRRGCGGIAISEGQMLIFGGICKPSGYASSFLVSVEEDTGETTVRALEPMKEGGGHWNHQKNVVKVGDSVYAICYKQNVHIFDTITRSWSAIKASQWKPS